MTAWQRWASAALASLAVSACDTPEPGGAFPAPSVPGDNPLTEASIELGRHLFYDARLSFNESISCSSCHQQQLAFADDRATSLGATGEPGVLNAPSLTNVAYAAPLTWAHQRVESIEEQLLGPMFGEAVLEMGMTGNEQLITERLAADPIYVELFADAYGPGALEPSTALTTARFALASFARSLISDDAPFDRFLAGDRSAITDSARRGSELFYSPRLGCGNCHAGFNLTVATRSAVSSGPSSSAFHNIGLYNIDGEGSYPESAAGLIEESGIARDNGRFRVPTLRNVGVTAPYMHDGSVETLEEVIEIYERGGRDVTAGPNAGDGRLSPLRSEELVDFELTAAERADLIAFLESLTDQRFLDNAALGNPW